MKKPIYIFNSGELKREDDTILFIKSDKKQTIPIKTISEIHVFGEISLNKRLLEFLNKNNIPVFFYNYYGFYIGSYYPKEYINSGIMILKQAQAYLNSEERLNIAKKFIYGGILNMLKNLYYYKKSKDNEIKPYIENIEASLKDIDSRQDIPSLMALEGETRKNYYEAFNIIINNEIFHIDNRTRRPPDSPMNSLISFGNALLYSSVLSQIYHTRLDPRIGFLHETNRRSFSLHLDISEIFKPIIVDRVIFSLINKNQIQSKHFERKKYFVYLNEKGREIFIKAYEDKLKTTINYKDQKKASYRRLIRMECYKLYRHFLGEEEYIPFTSDW